MTKPFALSVAVAAALVLAYGCSSDEPPGPKGSVAGQTGEGTGGHGPGGAGNAGGTSGVAGRAGAATVSAALGGGAPISTGGTQGFAGSSPEGGATAGGGTTNAGEAGGGAAGEVSFEVAGQAGSAGNAQAGAAGSADLGAAGAAGSGNDGAAGAAGSGNDGAAGAAGSADLGAAGAAGSALVAEDPRCATASAAATLTSHLRITSDNECDVYVNGQTVGQTTNWSAAVTMDVSLYVHPGRMNVVAVVGRNTSSQGGNDRGIIGQLTTTVGTMTSVLLVTDSNWRVSQTPGTDWFSLSYDDADWIAATEVASSGDSPWGNIMGTGSTAKWIWFAPIPVSTASKPNLEATYARRSFYFDFEGQLVSSPLCNEPGNWKQAR